MAWGTARGDEVRPRRGCLAWALAGCTPGGNSCRPRFCHHLAGRSPVSCLLPGLCVPRTHVSRVCPVGSSLGVRESRCVHDRDAGPARVALWPPRPGHGPAGLAFRPLACTQESLGEGGGWHPCCETPRHPPLPQMYAMKSSLESMDAMELDFRMRLAEVQPVQGKAASW